MQLYLLRHPPVLLPPGTCYGRLDAPPAPGWERVAEAWATELPRGLPLWSSPSSRCRLPAERLARILGSAPPRLDERLMELDFGRWEGRRWDELPPEETRPWFADWQRARVPGGEGYPELRARLLDFLEELAERGLERAGIVSHGGPLRALLAETLGLPLERAFELDLPHGALIELPGRRGVAR